MLKVRIYATLKQYVDERREVTVEMRLPLSVREVLELVFAGWPKLRPHVVDGGGELLPFVNVFVQGRSIRDTDGMATTVRPIDEFAIFPPVAGGALEALELRGVGAWLLRIYLADLGGHEEGAAVKGKGWTAHLEDKEPALVAGSLSLPAVLVTFEGDAARVEAVRDGLLKKAMRGGG